MPLLERHNYPEPVSKLLGEAVALVALLGTSLKFKGKLILQTKSDGLVRMLVVQFQTPGFVRGYASFDKEYFKSLDPSSQFDESLLLGHGHLAMTIDQGPDMERYQGIVALEGESLADAAHKYFTQSEQLPSLLKLAVARHYVSGEAGQAGHWSWRAGGLLVQDLTTEGGSLEFNHDLDDLDEVDEDGWNRICHLAATVEDHELLDPLLAPEKLLYRLFHEEQVRVFHARPIGSECSCSKEHIQSVLRQFSKRRNF